MPFQRQCWQAYLEGRSGLLQVPTGSGKTYAAVMGPIADLLADARSQPPRSEPPDHRNDLPAPGKNAAAEADGGAAWPRSSG